MRVKFDRSCANCNFTTIKNIFISIFVSFRSTEDIGEIWTYSASKDTTEFNIFAKDNSGFVPHHLDVNSICNCLTHVHFFSIGTWLYMLFSVHWQLGGRGPDFRKLYFDPGKPTYHILMGRPLIHIWSGLMFERNFVRLTDFFVQAI